MVRCNRVSNFVPSSKKKEEEMKTALNIPFQDERARNFEELPPPCRVNPIEGQVTRGMRNSFRARNQKKGWGWRLDVTRRLGV